MKEIELTGVNKIYKPDIVALEDVSMAVEPGEFIFVTGRSGSGKSTLLKLITGQIFASSGIVQVKGENPEELTKKELQQYRMQFGFMQFGEGLSESKTVRQNIEQAVRAASPRSLFTKKRAEQALDMVGVPNIGERYPDELSGGETVRAMLARTLVTNPSILVLDEPTARLDPSDSWDVMRLLKEINRKGITVIVTSHDRELVSIMKRRVITLNAGVKVADENNATYNTMAGDIFEGRKILERRAERRKLLNKK